MLDLNILEDSPHIEKFFTEISCIIKIIADQTIAKVL